jgi:hypothetical protein
MGGLAIKLGHRVRDALTGFEGIAQTKIEFLTGNVQYGVQPQCKPDSTDLPNAIGMDYHTLEVVDEGISHLAVAPVGTDIQLGWKVRDKATGFVGIAVQKHTFFNGCIYFQVIPPLKKDALINENSPMSFIEAARLEKVNDGLAEEASKSRVGGPRTKVMRPC